MSWSIDLKADQCISADDVQKVIDELPEELHGFMGCCSRQVWGWSCATDVLVPDGNILTIRGAGFSSHKAEDMARTVQSGLKKLGYKVRKGKIRL